MQGQEHDAGVQVVASLEGGCQAHFHRFRQAWIVALGEALRAQQAVAEKLRRVVSFTASGTRTGCKPTARTAWSRRRSSWDRPKMPKKPSIGRRLTPLRPARLRPAVFLAARQARAATGDDSGSDGNRRGALEGATGRTCMSWTTVQTVDLNRWNPRAGHERGQMVDASDSLVRYHGECGVVGDDRRRRLAHLQLSGLARPARPGHAVRGGLTGNGYM